MPTRTAQATWNGNLTDGHGTMRFGSGAFEGRYSFASRFEEGTGTNPEELIAAAHAGCFSMALSGALTGAGFPPVRVETRSKLKLGMTETGFRIISIELITLANVPAIEAGQFQEVAESAKRTCPVSQALTGVEIKLRASLDR